MEKRTVVLFAVLIAVIIGRGLTLWRSVSVLEAREQALKHSQERLGELGDLLSVLKDAETGQRGYLLTGRIAYLEPYHSAVVNVDIHLAHLAALVADDAPQRESFEEVRRQVAANMSELETTVLAMSNDGRDTARSLVLTDDGKQTMDAVRRLIAEMIGRENRTLADLRTDFKVTAVNARSSILFATVAVLLVGAFFFYEVWRGALARAALVTQAETAFRNEAEAREEVERASRLKDEFLATLSHELRDPLNAMLSWASLMRTGKVDQDTLSRGLETIERNARSQAQLIDDLLDMSRIVSGKMRLGVDEVDLHHIVESAVEVVRPGAEAKAVRIHTVLDPRAGHISGDPERIQQILWNLLSNAVKFTPKGGRIEVRLEQVNSHVAITVSDTGQGIDADFLPYVFDRFRQGDSSAARSHAGLGLGLGIAKQLVELQGGTIRADSEGIGQGAVFTVHFPVRAVRAGQPTAVGEGVSRAAVGAGDAGLAGLRILAVDDQLDTLDMLRAVLVRHQALVETASSADSGIEMFLRWRPDVLVADIGMPVTDGYAFIAAIRALPEKQGGRVPAIALTAFARVEDRIRALASGYQMHMAKPVEPTELVVAVASLTHRVTRVETA